MRLYHDIIYQKFQKFDKIVGIKNSYCNYSKGHIYIYIHIII